MLLPLLVASSWFISANLLAKWLTIHAFKMNSAMSTRLCLVQCLIWFLCFRFDAWTELGAFMRTEFLCISVLRVASGPRVKLASCKSALTPLASPRPAPPPPPPPVVYSSDRSKAVVSVLVFLFGALWFILRGDLLYVLPCSILFLCFSVFLALRLPRLGKRELILVLFVCLIDLCLFGFSGFFFLLMSGKGCGLWLWPSLDFLLSFFTLLTVLRRWSRCWSYSLVLCGLFYEAICCMFYLVPFWFCVFQSI